MSDKIMDDASIALVAAANLPISLAAIEEIIMEEDSSQSYYVSHYQHPEWPGGASGVTILLGYDLGYATADKIHADLDGKLPTAMVDACISVAGITGEAAHSAMLRVRSQIVCPWSVALDVFLHRDMPQWIATVRKVLPNTDKLSGDSLGAIVSLAYNRGASFDRIEDRYREMRQIKADMAAQHFADIPAQILAMRRLWPIGGDLWRRRGHEALLFKRGLGRNLIWAQHALNLVGFGPVDEDDQSGPQTNRLKAEHTNTSRGRPCHDGSFRAKWSGPASIPSRISLGYRIIRIRG